MIDNQNVCVTIVAIDNNQLLERILRFFLLYCPELIVSIWGSLSNATLHGLELFSISKMSICSVLFGEHNYLIYVDNVEEFIIASGAINLHEHAWAISTKKTGIVLARNNMDITICNIESVDNSALVKLCEDLKADGVIIEFEFVSE